MAIGYSGHLSSHSLWHFRPAISVLCVFWFPPVWWPYKQTINVSASLFPAHESGPDQESCLRPWARSIHPSHPTLTLRRCQGWSWHICPMHYYGCAILKAKNSIGSLPQVMWLQSGHISADVPSSVLASSAEIYQPFLIKNGPSV